MEADKADKLRVTVDLPVEVHDDGDGQWIARVTTLPDVVGMGRDAIEARKDAKAKATEVIVAAAGNRDLDRPTGTASAGTSTGDPRAVADRIAAAAMDVLRNRSRPDAQTHAALRDAVLTALQGGSS